MSYWRRRSALSVVGVGPQVVSGAVAVVVGCWLVDQVLRFSRLGFCWLEIETSFVTSEDLLTARGVA